MQNIKKPYQEIVELLQANQDKKVSSVLDAIIEIALSKKKDSTIRYAEDGTTVTHIFCWYHKEWESVDLFGDKASSHSGKNTMCKQGVNCWTKQQRDFKKSKADLLELLQSGDLKVEDLQSEIEKLEKIKDRIEPRKEEK